MNKYAYMTTEGMPDVLVSVLREMPPSHYEVRICGTSAVCQPESRNLTFVDEAEVETNLSLIYRKGRVS